jgi:glycosyltransferase involved in cell wall biosynthesis
MVSLDMVGDDRLVEDQRYVQRVKAFAKGNQIVYHGEKTRAECPAYFTMAKALLHCNAIFREPFGLAPVEAMLCGCPVIAWDHGAMRETVKHGETGFLVRTYDELRDLLDKDAVKGISSERCRKWALKFSAENMVNRYEDLCKQAVEAGW